MFVFDALLSMWMVLALDSESLGSPKEEAVEALGEGEGGGAWSLDMEVSGSSWTIRREGCGGGGGGGV